MGAARASRSRHAASDAEITAQNPENGASRTVRLDCKAAEGAATADICGPQDSTYPQRRLIYM